MHLFGRTKNRIHRTGLDAEGAANAQLLLDPGHRARFMYTMFWIERPCFYIKQLGQSVDCHLAAWRALIDIRLAARNRFGIRAAADIPALRALRLRQPRIDGLNQLIEFRSLVCKIHGLSMAPPTGAGKNSGGTEAIDPCISNVRSLTMINVGWVKPRKRRTQQNHRFDGSAPLDPSYVTICEIGHYFCIYQ